MSTTTTKRAEAMTMEERAAYVRATYGELSSVLAAVKRAQESLNDKGFNAGAADGVMGARTRAAVRRFQESEKLPVTGRLDTETAGRLGVGPDSVGGNFTGAGHDVAEGSRELGHEVKQGKPIAAGKEFGKGIGRAAEKIGDGVVDAVSPDSDRGDREEQQKKN